ncbi:MAG TPA: DJ-1/PfpI family protein [Blastocatellia bacterium]|jgi:putative intracellular protease/amidase|nr:DJ-1/PfpI family protein [Blastocatellia bacterium]
MKSVSTYIFVAAFIAVLVSLSLDAPGTESAYSSRAAEKKAYVCPPCGCGKDDAVFEAAGSCDACGMALVEKGSPASRPMSMGSQADTKRVAILIFDGVQIIDYTGPYEVFGQSGYSVYTVAERPDAITTAMGMKVVPSYTLENVPPPNVIVIPGGEVTDSQNNQKIIKWIQESSKQAEYVLSVCNGAYILASTGLLDGLSATTFYDLIDGLATVAPKTKLVRDQRYVDNGKIITTAGISSGIDGSLYLVSKMMGKARAQMAALNMEYHWQPESTFARASLADVHIRKVFSRRLRLTVPTGAESRVLNTEGGRDQWEVSWEVKSDGPPAEILKSINNSLVTQGKWSMQPAGKANGSTQSSWTFSDEKGLPWAGSATIKPAGAPGNYSVAIRVNRLRGA